MIQLTNIIHTLALVLPTIIINMLDSGIAHFISLERVIITSQFIGLNKDIRNQQLCTHLLSGESPPCE